MSVECKLEFQYKKAFCIELIMDSKLCLSEKPALKKLLSAWKYWLIKLKNVQTSSITPTVSIDIETRNVMMDPRNPSYLHSDYNN